MAPSIVQVAGNSGTSTVSIGSGQGWSTPASGNWIVIHAVADVVLSTPSGYSLAVSGVNYSGNYIWYKQSNGTESTLSFSGGSGSARVYQAYELAGMESSGVLDRTTSGGFGDNATSQSSGTTATTTVADEVAIAGAGGYQTYGPISVSSWSNSYTEQDDRWQAPDMGATASRILTSTQTTSTTASFSSNLSGGFVLLATFKGGAGATDLTIQGSDHTTASDGVTLSQTHNLSVNGSDHTTASDGAALVSIDDLTAGEAAHTVASDNVALTQTHFLAIQDASHATQSDQVGLTQTHNLQAADAAHSHVSEGVVLSLGSVSLSIASAEHTHAVDEATLEHVHVLSIDEARHETRDASGVFTDSFNYSAGDLEVVSSDWNAQGGTYETGRLLVPWVTTGSGSIEIERSLSWETRTSSAALVNHTFGNNQWMEVDFQVPATVNESWAIEVCLRFRDDETAGYLASLYNWIDPVSGYGGVSIGSFLRGAADPDNVQWKTSAQESAPYSFTPGQTYTFRAEISGSTITAWLDGVQKLQWTDPGTDQDAQHDSGRLGLIGYSENYDGAWTNFDSPQIVDVRAAGDVSLVAVDDLSIQGSDHVIASDNATLSEVPSLAIADAAHVTSSDNVAIVGQGSLSIQGADHLTTSDNVPLSQIHSLSIGESTHTHASDNITLLGQGDLDIASADHVVASDQADLTSVSILSIADADHSIVSDEVVLVGYADLTIADSSVVTTSDEVAVTSGTSLAIQEAFHSHTADALALSQTHNLSVAESSHASASDEVTLTDVVSLTIAESAHAHAADGITVERIYVLEVDGAQHTLTSDGVDLVTITPLVVSDAVHVTASDEIRVTYVGDLVVQDAYHTVASDSLELFFGAVLDVEGDALTLLSDEIEAELWAVESGRGAGGTVTGRWGTGDGVTSARGVGGEIEYALVGGG